MQATAGMPALTQLDCIGALLEFKTQNAKKKIYRMERDDFFEFLMRSYGITPNNP